MDYPGPGGIALPWHSVCVPAPQGHCPGGLQSCWHHTRELGGMIPELLVEHCPPTQLWGSFGIVSHPQSMVFRLPRSCFPHGFFSSGGICWENLAFTKNMFSVKQPVSFHSPGSLSPPLLNLHSQPVSAVAAGIEP